MSFGPRTPDGAKAWDTFMTLTATAKKLGVSIYHYIHDRVSADYDIQIVYLQPNNPEGSEDIISFQDAAQIIRQHDDEPQRAVCTISLGVVSGWAYFTRRNHR